MRPRARLFLWSAFSFSSSQEASVLYGLGLMSRPPVGSISGPLSFFRRAGSHVLHVWRPLGGGGCRLPQAMILMPFCWCWWARPAAHRRTVRPLPLAFPPQMVSMPSARAVQLGYVVCWTLDGERRLQHWRNGTAILQRGHETISQKSSSDLLPVFSLQAHSSGLFRDAMRVIYPDLAKVLPTLRIRMRLLCCRKPDVLPNGLIGIMLAAMFSSAMANLSGMFNLMQASCQGRLQTAASLKPTNAPWLRAGRVTTFAVAVSVDFLAVLLAVTGKSIFSVLVTFQHGHRSCLWAPALLGLVIQEDAALVGSGLFCIGLASAPSVRLCSVGTGMNVQ